MLVCESTDVLDRGIAMHLMILLVGVLQVVVCRKGIVFILLPEGSFAGRGGVPDAAPYGNLRLARSPASWDFSSEFLVLADGHGC